LQIYVLDVILRGTIYSPSRSDLAHLQYCITRHWYFFEYEKKNLDLV
jgi:hypothetical protein